MLEVLIVRIIPPQQVLQDVCRQPQALTGLPPLIQLVVHLAHVSDRNRRVLVVVGPIETSVDGEGAIVVFKGLPMISDPAITSCNAAEVICPFFLHGTHEVVVCRVSVPEQLSLLEVGAGCSIVLFAQINFSEGIDVRRQGDVVVVKLLIYGNRVIDIGFGSPYPLLLVPAVGRSHHDVPTQLVQDLSLQPQSQVLIELDFLLGSVQAFV